MTDHITGSNLISDTSRLHHRGFIVRMWTNWQNSRAMDRLDTLDYHILKDMGFRR